MPSSDVQSTSRASRPFACGIAALGSAVALSARAADPPTLVVYVDQSAPAAGQDGTSWNHAFRNLQDAIQFAKNAISLTPSDLEIRVAQGVYKPDRATFDRAAIFDLSFALASGMTLTIAGSYAGVGAAHPDQQDFVATRTVLSGDLRGDDAPSWSNRDDNSLQVAQITLAAGSARILGVTFAAGYCGDNNVGRTGASGLQVELGRQASGLCIMENCSFEENWTISGQGGGFFANVRGVSLASTSFRMNRCDAGYGGGAFVNTVPFIGSSVQDCIFEGNSAIRGGGLYRENYEGVRRCVFVSNSASERGGGICGTGGPSVCLFVRNSAGVAGGALAGKWPSATWCTFVDNTAPSGSAITIDGTDVSVRYSILWTSAPSAASLIRLDDKVHNSLILRSVIRGGGGAIEVVSFAPTIIEVKDADPLFIRPGQPQDPYTHWTQWNYRLKTGSPAIGIADSLGGMDLDRLYFFENGKPDAGAYFASHRPCSADLNQAYPRIVDDADFEIFVSAYYLLVSPPADPRADLNRDGLVDDADFLLFVVAYDQLLCP